MDFIWSIIIFIPAFQKTLVFVKIFELVRLIKYLTLTSVNFQKFLLVVFYNIKFSVKEFLK